MKKIVLFSISVLILTLNISTFAATGVTVDTGANSVTEKSSFAVSDMKIIDDKNIEFTFDSALAEEPVEIKIIKISDNSELGIEDVQVDKARTKVSVKLVDGLKKDETYGYFIVSALSEKGKKINETDKDIKDLEIPEGLTLPDSTDGENSEELTKSMQEAFEGAKENPETVGETKTESLDAAPVVDSGATTVSPAPIVPQQQDINIANSKQLPKTGPAESLLIIIALAIGGYVVYLKRNKIKV